MNWFCLPSTKDISAKKTLPSMRRILRQGIERKPQRRKKSQRRKKRGRKPKAEYEQWLKEKQAEDDARPIYEKEIVHQRSESVETLFKEAPIEPKWGIKKNSDG
ncbi:hypothetical protein G4V62_19450, partial [Bacillaceae bacterium SIJ1]|nr:hypothetical protein [Litoribacterium kuwaitense]